MSNKGKLWTSAEEDALRTQVFQGASLKSISLQLGRTERSIRARASFLKLPLRTFETKRDGVPRYG
jgi:hypothetical protein